jgi:hypothetical protein
MGVTRAKGARRGPQLYYIAKLYRIAIYHHRENPATRETDMMMFNSANLGALIVKHDPEIKSWEDNFYGIQSIGIDEQYGFGIINDGQAIAVARNVRVVPNEFVLLVRTVAEWRHLSGSKTRGTRFPMPFATSPRRRRAASSDSPGTSLPQTFSPRGCPGPLASVQWEK